MTERAYWDALVLVRLGDFGEEGGLGNGSTLR
jgi:hypothetical protein